VLSQLLVTKLTKFCQKTDQRLETELQWHFLKQPATKAHTNHY